MPKIVDIDKDKRVSRQALDLLIAELQELRDTNPKGIDSVFIAYGVDKNTKDSRYKGRIAYKSFLFGIDFGITGFITALLSEANSSMLYDGAVSDLPEEFIEKDEDDQE